MAVYGIEYLNEWVDPTKEKSLQYTNIKIGNKTFKVYIEIDIDQNPNNKNHDASGRQFEASKKISKSILNQSKLILDKLDDYLRKLFTDKYSGDPIKHIEPRIIHLNINGSGYIWCDCNLWDGEKIGYGIAIKFNKNIEITSVSKNHTYVYK